MVARWSTAVVMVATARRRRRRRDGGRDGGGGGGGGGEGSARQHLEEDEEDEEAEEDLEEEEQHRPRSPAGDEHEVSSKDGPRARNAGVRTGLRNSRRLDVVLASRRGEVGVMGAGRCDDLRCDLRAHMLWACRGRAACASASQGRRHTSTHPPSACTARGSRICPPWSPWCTALRPASPSADRVGLDLPHSRDGGESARAQHRESVSGARHAQRVTCGRGEGAAIEDTQHPNLP